MDTDGDLTKLAGYVHATDALADGFLVILEEVKPTGHWGFHADGSGTYVSEDDVVPASARGMEPSLWEERVTQLASLGPLGK